MHRESPSSESSPRPAKRPLPVLAAEDPVEEILRQRAEASATQWKSIVIGAFAVGAIFLYLELVKPAAELPAAEPSSSLVEPVPEIPRAAGEESVLDSARF